VCSIIYIPRKFSGLLSTSKTIEPNRSVHKARERRSLPDFSNGGIIVFYHNYKTGGSTVGKLLHELAQHDQGKFSSQKNPQHNDGAEIFEIAKASPARMFFTMIRKRITWEKECLTSLKVAEKNKKLILLELHVEHPAPDFPSLVELAPLLEKWRIEADRRGLGFFSFTLLREPIAHALSFFNFFHVGNKKNLPPPTNDDHDFWNPFRPLDSTQKNFLYSYYTNNKQCQMLSVDPQATRGAPDDLVWDQRRSSKEDIAEFHQPCRVDKVYDAFVNSLDWVGTTENLQNETLPLLTKLIANDPSLGRHVPPFKVFDENRAGAVGMKKLDLSKKTMDTILKRTELDRELYDEVKRMFRLSDLGWDYQSPVEG